MGSEAKFSSSFQGFFMVFVNVQEGEKISMEQSVSSGGVVEIRFFATLQKLLRRAGSPLGFIQGC